jgi:hypothetical protein
MSKIRYNVSFAEWQRLVDVAEQVATHQTKILHGLGDVWEEAGASDLAALKRELQHVTSVETGLGAVPAAIGPTTAQELLDTCEAALHTLHTILYPEHGGVCAPMQDRLYQVITKAKAEKLASRVMWHGFDILNLLNAAEYQLKEALKRFGLNSQSLDPMAETVRDLHACLKAVEQHGCGVDVDINLRDEEGDDGSDARAGAERTE